GRVPPLAPLLRISRVAERGLVPPPAVGLEGASRGHCAHEREIARALRERVLRPVEAAPDVRPAEWTEQPLIDAVAFDRRQSRVLRRHFAAVLELEAPQLQRARLTPA